MADQSEDATVPRVAPLEVHDIAPALGWYSDYVLFHQIWNRPLLTRRDRSLLTVSALVACGHYAQLTGHINRALNHGVTSLELVELVTHLAFYSGWPVAMSSLKVVREVFASRDIEFASIGQAKGTCVDPSLHGISVRPFHDGEGAFSNALSASIGKVVAYDLWDRRELSVRDRHLISLASMVAAQVSDVLLPAARQAMTEGLTSAELCEAVVHLSFYVGFPKAQAAARTLDVLGEGE